MISGSLGSNACVNIGTSWGKGGGNGLRERAGAYCV